MTANLCSPLVAEDLIAAKSSLQGELLWEFCAPWDGLSMQLVVAGPKLTAVTAGDTLMLFMLDMPFVECGKYPPGEGSPSGPKPGLRLSTRAGGLHR